MLLGIKTQQQRHLLLLGAGHTHVLALAHIAQQSRLSGCKVTLVCGESLTPYSGMLPGLIAGLYKRSEIVLDAAALARRYKIQHIDAHAQAIDLPRREVKLETGERVGYDLLSINIGGHCNSLVCSNNAMPIKPVLPFLDWQTTWQDKHKLTCAIVGGGVAGAELALCIDAYLRKHNRRGGVFLIGCNPELIPGKPGLSKEVSRLFVRRGISQLLGRRVSAVEPGLVRMDSQECFSADKVVLCTGVNAWPGLKDSGLQVDEKGFVLVNDNLQSVSNPEVFACGDCGTLVNNPVAKSGVYAVRQAPVLACNLLLALTGGTLQPWQQQRATLAIVCAGTRHAIAYRNGMVAQGWLMWCLKNYLDRSFMRKFQ